MLAAGSVQACGGDSSGSGAGDEPSSASGGPGASGAGAAGAGGFSPTTSASGGPSNCTSNPGVDDDGDGYTEPEDCNDCDPNVNPGAIDVVVTEPQSPSDDVTRSFEGGFGGDFVYDIPADHMGGTYWYHAHHHGSTYLQISGGAFGQLIVDDGNDGIPAKVAAMTERQLVIAYLDPGVAGTGGDTLMSGTLTPTWTVNGMVQGNFCAPQNEWQHWRVLLADRVATEKTLSVGSNCEVALLAR